MPRKRRDAFPALPFRSGNHVFDLCQVVTALTYTHTHTHAWFSDASGKICPVPAPDVSGNSRCTVFSPKGALYSTRFASVQQMWHHKTTPTPPCTNPFINVRFEWRHLLSWSAPVLFYNKERKSVMTRKRLLIFHINFRSLPTLITIVSLLSHIRRERTRDFR